MKKIILSLCVSIAIAWPKRKNVGLESLSSKFYFILKWVEHVVISIILMCREIRACTWCIINSIDHTLLCSKIYSISLSSICSEFLRIMCIPPVFNVREINSCLWVFKKKNEKWKSFFSKNKKIERKNFSFSSLLFSSK